MNDAMRDRRPLAEGRGQGHSPPLALAVRLIGILCAVLILSQFYRTAAAVMAPNLMRDPGLNATDLGLLSGAFFAAAGLMQLPVGILLDRYGPRAVVPSLMTIAVAGALLFALAEARVALLLGQFLIGAGCSGIFMGGLVVVGRWYPPDRFATVSAILVSLSGAGVLASGTPFAAVIEAFGWRGGYLVMAGLTALLGLAVFFFVRDAPPGHPAGEPRRETLRETLRGLGHVLTHPQMRGLFAISFVAYGTIIAVRGLWAGPYLADIHGLDTIARGNVLLIISIGFVVGAATYGPLDRIFNTRKGIVLTGASINATILLVLAFSQGLSLVQATALFTGVCFAGTFYVHVLAHGRSFFEPALAGRAMTALNFATFMGVGVIQIATGAIVESYVPPGEPAPEAAYRTVFGVLGGALILMTLVYSRTRDARPRG